MAADAVILEVVDGDAGKRAHPGSLTATVHVVFSKELLREARTDGPILDLVAEDAKKRLRSLLDRIPA